MSYIVSLIFGEITNLTSDCKLRLRHAGLSLTNRLDKWGSCLVTFSVLSKRVVV